MRPVVGGLQAEFPNQFLFERYDFDDPAQRQEANERLHLPVHPAFALIDRHGTIVERLIGPVPEAVLREKLIALINTP